MKYTKIQIENDGTFSGTRDGDMPFTANFTLFLIAQARDRGCDFEDLADGYGVGRGTGPDKDWSGIRDSTDEACTRMLERALNHLFGEKANPLIAAAPGLLTELERLLGTRTDSPDWGANVVSASRAVEAAKRIDTH